MTWAHAGQYGAEGVGDSNGRPLPGQPVHVYQPDGVTTATLYADRTKGSTIANPTTADSNGNLTLWLEPGQYVLSTVINGRTVSEGMTVLPDPADVAPLSQVLYVPGTLAARPSAAALSDGVRYSTAGDPADGGGAVYVVQSGLWVPETPQVNATSGTELGYAERTSNTTTTSTSYGDLTGLSVTFTQGSRPVYFHFQGEVLHSVSGGAVIVKLVVDSTTDYGAALWTSPAAGGTGTLNCWARPNPLLAAGSHTVKMQWLIVTAGTGTLTGSATNNRPFLRVIAA